MAGGRCPATWAGQQLHQGDHGGAQRHGNGAGVDRGASAWVEGQCVGSASITGRRSTLGGSVITTCQKVSDRPMPCRLVRFTRGADRPA